MLITLPRRRLLLLPLLLLVLLLAQLAPVFSLTHAPPPSTHARRPQQQMQLQLQQLLKQQRVQHEWCVSIRNVLRLFHRKVRSEARGIGKCDHIFPTEVGYSALKQIPSGTFFHHVLQPNTLRVGAATQLVQANDSLAGICRSDTRRPTHMLPWDRNRKSKSNILNKDTVDGESECSDLDISYSEPTARQASHYKIHAAKDQVTATSEPVIWAPPAIIEAAAAAAAAAAFAGTRQQQRIPPLLQLYPGAATASHSFLSLGAKSWTFSNSNRSSVASHDGARLQLYFATDATSHRIDVGNYLAKQITNKNSSSSEAAAAEMSFRRQKCAEVSDFFLLIGYPVTHVYDSRHDECAFAITICHASTATATATATKSKNKQEGEGENNGNYDDDDVGVARLTSPNFDVDDDFDLDYAARATRASEIRYVLRSRAAVIESMYAQVEISRGLAITQFATHVRITWAREGAPRGSSAAGAAFAAPEWYESYDVAADTTAEQDVAYVNRRCVSCLLASRGAGKNGSKRLRLLFAEYAYGPRGAATLQSRHIDFELGPGPKSLFTSIVSRNLNATLSTHGRAAHLVNTVTGRSVRVSLAYAKRPAHGATSSSYKYHGAHFVGSVRFPLYPAALAPAA